MHGNPWLRLLRREVEALAGARHGDRYVSDQQARAELTRVNRGIKPKLLGGGMSPTALTWAFASSVAKSSGYMLTSANVIMVSGHGHGFCVQKNHALISVLAGQGGSIYAGLQ